MAYPRLLSGSALTLRLLCLGSAVLGVAACGGESEGPAPEEAGPLTGTAVDTYLHDGQEIHQPRTDLTLAVLVPGDGERFDSIPVTIDGEGNFVAEDIPEGDLYLEVTPAGGSSTYLVGSARSFDLGTRFLRRPDAVSATSETPLLLTATGLNPVQGGDNVQIYSPGSGTLGHWGFYEEDIGATAVADLMTDVTYFLVPNLVEGTKGDEAHLTQNALSISDGVEVISTRRAFKAASITQVNGEAMTIEGTFEELPQQPHQVDWKRAQFASLAEAAHPEATVSAHVADVTAEVAPGLRSLTPSLATAYTTDPSDGTVDLAFGDPYGWGHLVGASVSYDLSVSLPGFASPKLLFGYASSFDYRDDWSSLDLAPRLGPPTHVRINDQDSTASLTGVGLTPTISWSAPELGEPTTYRLTVRLLLREGTSRIVATLLTASTQVRLPPGVLEMGEYYYVQVASERGSQPTSPYAMANSSDMAMAIANAFTP
ncbi:hypothetical protein [Chondromyces crocatus]|uniref:Fibronectin type-III domain-containing protein n=1 Tax=Chondromyces crocatus TaxID=52 RepID=A0A0K1ETW3_CHOCO|nr:hypothetical protein [Chondromyces crocatus]AKT44077.1 uncharacterized protein CMC5_083150 [Chondromyces crocatus]